MKAKPTSVSIKLSAESVKALDALAKRFKVDQSEMIERLIFGSAQTPAQE